MKILERINRKTKYLGRFSDFIEAVAHRLAAEQCLNWGNCDCASSSYRFMHGEDNAHS